MRPARTPRLTWPWAVLAGVALLVAGALPTVAALRMRAAAAAAQEAAAALRTPVLPSVLTDPAGPAVSSPLPLLRAERAPQVLWQAAQRHRIGAEMAAFSSDWPQPHCLSIAVDGVVVFTSNDEPLIPASVQKLVTAAALMAVTQPSERLVTRVLADSPIVEGTLEGNLWVVGGGDPLVMTQGYADSFRRQPQLRTAIEDLADELAALGIERLRGSLIADESRYDTTRFPQTWPQRYITQLNSGPLSALSLNDGFSGFTNIKAAAEHPARWFVSTLVDLLRLRGVSVSVEIDVAAAPSGLTELARLESPPMIEIAQQMLRESDNATAELMLREIGLRATGEGSTPAGAAVTQRIVSEMLADASGDATGQGAPLTVVDGSGLDRQNQMTCGFLVALLEHLGADSELLAGLPVAAESGTLSHRFEDHPAARRLRAKTGLLAGVNALAGFVETDSGRVTFAQILNGTPPEGRVGLDLQEALVGQLLRYPVGDADKLEELARHG